MDTVKGQSPIVFGKTFVCKRCGHVAQSKSRFKVSASEQRDAYMAEFCEYCVPGSMLGFLSSIAFAEGEAQP
jgi:transcription elongation factor Elf1